MALIGLRYQVSPDAFLFSVDGLGRFHVQGGRRITVEPQGAATPSALAEFVFGLALGVALQQRGLLVLHGAALATPDGEALLLLGPSGVGKSTLCAALLDAGLAFISDELCVLDCDASGCWVTPGEPAQRLWPSALADLDRDPRQYEPISAASEKRIVPVPHSQCAPRTRVARAYVLGVDGRGAPAIAPVRGAAKINALAECIYRPVINGAMWSDRYRFERLAQVGEAGVAVSRLNRPLSGSCVADLRQAILEEQGRCGAGEA